MILLCDTVSNYTQTLYERYSQYGNSRLGLNSSDTCLIPYSSRTLRRPRTSGRETARTKDGTHSTSSRRISSSPKEPKKESLVNTSTNVVQLPESTLRMFANMEKALAPLLEQAKRLENIGKQFAQALKAITEAVAKCGKVFLKLITGLVLSRVRQSGLLNRRLVVELLRIPRRIPVFLLKLISIMATHSGSNAPNSEIEIRSLVVSRDLRYRSRLLQ